MIDKLIDRINAHRSAPNIYDRADFLDMEARILADAKIIKAAEELADAVEAIETCEDGANLDRLHDEFVSALAAYRAAVSERDTCRG